MANSIQKNLLIELFTEELPPKALKSLGESFASSIVSSLSKKSLVAAQPTFQSFCSPRHLAVLVDYVSDFAADQTMELKGPSAKVGLDAKNEPTQALIKWAEKQGVAVADLTQASDGKQDCFYAKALVKGAILADSIQAIVEDAIAKLPIPKVMQYQLADGTTSVSFVRPAHRVIVLHGSRVLPMSVLGMQSDRLTQGHRFQGNQVISIAHTDAYEAALFDARVLVSFERRKANIAEQLQNAAIACGLRLSGNSQATDEQALAGELTPYLDEVTALVEWPKVYAGAFDKAFLAVPQECLILTMRTNQKYFPLFDSVGKLSEQFLIVSNMDIADPVHIIEGNQRVVRPRLADAQFFFEQDKRTTLSSRIEQLDKVIYHAKLGTQAQRSARVSQSAEQIAQRIGADPIQAKRAAQLAKCDLITDMVGEFPELQGTMGQYYAAHDGELADVARAIAQHYQPRFAGDQLPSDSIGVAVALADKIETLCGIWGVGQQPTGDKDPYALRRQALGVIRMLIERNLTMSLSNCLQIGFSQLQAIPNINADGAGLSNFIIERLRGYLRDKGFDANAIDAVLAKDSDHLNTVMSRLTAVTQFALLPEAQSLAAANKRIGNILRKSAQGEFTDGPINDALLSDAAEQSLYQALIKIEPVIQAHQTQNEYGQSLTELAALRAPVDQFFNDVMVMADDTAVKTNRLRLLSRLHRIMNQSADLARLAA